MKTVKVVVVGAGVVGLSTAVCIAEAFPFCSVTILAEKFSPDTTSDGAAGILLPKVFSGKGTVIHQFKDRQAVQQFLLDLSLWFPQDVSIERQRRWFKDTFDHLLAIAESPNAPEAGVFLSSGYQIFKEVPSDTKPYWSDYVFGFRTMTDEEMKRFPNHKFGQSFTTIKCECHRYLPWLEKRFKAAGGQIKREKVTDLKQLTHYYDVVVNCAGLGSRSLAGDEGVHPVRGQILKVHAPWVKNFIRDGDGKTYIYPGISYTTLGGTRQTDDWRSAVDKRDSEGIAERCGQLVPALRRAQVLEEWVGLRPGRRNPRVDNEWLQTQGHGVLVVHNYGHGGCGISLSWGTALDTLHLVQKGLHELPHARL